MASPSGQDNAASPTRELGTSDDSSTANASPCKTPNMSGSGDRVLEDTTAEAIVLSNPPLSTPIKAGDLVYVIARPKWERRRGPADYKVTEQHDKERQEGKHGTRDTRRVGSPHDIGEEAQQDNPEAGQAAADDEEAAFESGPFFSHKDTSAPGVGLNRFAPVVDVPLAQQQTQRSGSARRRHQRDGEGPQQRGRDSTPI